MQSNIEKNLNINIIISMGITIFAIIVAIVSLNNIINKIVDLKKVNMQIAINVLKIAEMNLEKQSIIKDIIINHNDKNYMKSNSKKYYALLKKMNYKMSLTEKLLGKKTALEQFANMYIKLYEVIVKNTKSEKYILKNITIDNFPEAMKEFKIKNKRYNTDIDGITNSFYSMAISETQKRDSFEKRNFFFIIFLNLLAFIVFVILSLLTFSKISKRLTKLHNTTKNIYNGDLETPVEMDTNDEIGELAKALDRLRQSFDKSNKMVNKKRL